MAIALPGDGGSHKRVVAFLDRLAGGESGSPEVRGARAAFRERVERMQRFRSGQCDEE